MFTWQNPDRRKLKGRREEEAWEASDSPTLKLWRALLSKSLEPIPTLFAKALSCLRVWSRPVGRKLRRALLSEGQGLNYWTESLGSFGGLSCLRVWSRPIGRKLRRALLSEG